MVSRVSTTPQNSSSDSGFTFEKLQNEIINFAAVIVAWDHIGILRELFDKYADINYDKVTNVTNTPILAVN